jgi:hypothetical protein
MLRKVNPSPGLFAMNRVSVDMHNLVFLRGVSPIADLYI